MDTAYLALALGGALSALVGLFGIWLTKRDNLDTLDLISPEELKSYRISRLVSDGIAWCSMGKHEFRPGPNASTTNCTECLPPELVDNVIERVVGQAKEGRAQPWNKRVYAGSGQKPYTPLHMTEAWSDLFKGEDEER